MSYPRTIDIGAKIRFRPSYLDHDVDALVIGVTRFPWCPGASTLHCYAPDTHGIYALSLIGGSYAITGQATFEEAIAAAEHFKSCLATFPVWAERFRRNPAYAVFASWAAA